MGDAIQRTVVFLRDVREILRKRDDERVKCPRCKGCGLLILQPGWRQGQSSQSNAPCLFCEGIGVMPVVGLRGYILGRADAMLSTKEIKTRPALPEDMFSGDFPGLKCTRFTYRKHFKSSPQLLYNPLSNPEWLREAEREAFVIKARRMEAVDHSFDPRDCDDRSPVGLIGLDHAGWRHRHRFYARTSVPFSTPKTPQVGDMSNEFQKYQGGQAADGSLRFEGIALEQISKGVEQSVDLSSLSDVCNSSQKEFYGRKAEGLSTRGHRFSRRPRNRIRDKARKEAEVRARRVQQSLSPVSEETPASLWNPLLRMCRFLLLSGTSAATKY